jgi:Holliday junction DNA helicase RuvA
VKDSVLAALVGLGWPERAALQGLDSAWDAATALERETMPALLRLALAHLGPQQAAAK